MARVRSERDRFVGFVVDTVEQWPAAHRWLGHARFVDTNTLVVEGRAGAAPSAGAAHRHRHRFAPRRAAGRGGLHSATA